jgi:hypothetical protein
MAQHEDNLSIEIERVAIDRDRLAKFTCEDDFLELIVQLMIEVGSYTCLAACTLGQSSTWDRDHAAIGGNMVRIYKLIHALLDQICQRRGEIVFIVTRLLFEALVNVRYLIQEFSPEIVDSYITYSLKHERKLRDVINANIEARGGIMLPIEDRMLKSINRTASAANLSLDNIDSKRQKNWGGKNAFEETQHVGLEEAYLLAFSSGSNSIHGNWQEIAGHHLEWDERTGRFTPLMDWARPRPQVPLAFGRLIVDTLDIYFAFMGGTAASEQLAPRLSDLQERLVQVGQAHENYLAPKEWPEI